MGTAAELHRVGVLSAAGPPAGRLAEICEVTRPAVVLGSSQPDSTVDRHRAEQAGIDVVRRRSGGGAVMVAPGAQAWLNVFVPVGDPLWSDDVGRASWWLGELWARLLERAGIGPSDIAVRLGGAGVGAGGAGGLRCDFDREGAGACGARAGGARAGGAGAGGAGGRWARLLCFAGVGSGEVLVRGMKVLGISQRRDRYGAWFHSSLLLDLDAERLVSVLALDDLTRRGAVEALRATSAPARVDPSIVTAGLASVLAAPVLAAGDGSG